jgi:tetratricopeptide (TPR) repeat protein
MPIARLHTITTLTAALLLAGCATTRPEPEPAGPTVELDPMVLKARNGKVQALQARPLFKAATEAYSRGRYEEALEKFKTIVEEFPDTKYAPHALFNAGLAAMRLQRWEEGLGYQRRARKALAGGRDEWDALLQVSLCLEKLKRWPELRKTALEILKKGKLGITGRVEARARLGMARFHTGRLALAERAFDRVLADYRKNNGVPSLRNNAYVSQAQYFIGEIYRGLFDSIRFRLPVERMKRDLTDKSAFFLKGQSAYLRCVRFQHEYWAVAAGYRLGKLYEDFYDDMMAAEVPPELDDEDKKVYYAELRNHIKPLVIRAIEVYERNLGMSDRLGQDGDWAKKTRASLDRMRDILRREFQ